MDRPFVLFVTGCTLVVSLHTFFGFLSSTFQYQNTTMADPLPVPAQLEAQLGKCKTVRDANTFVKDRKKSPQVNHNRFIMGKHKMDRSICPIECHFWCLETCDGVNGRANFSRILLQTTFFSDSFVVLQCISTKL